MFTVLSALHFLTLCGTEISAGPGTVIDAVAGQEVQFPVDNQCEDQYDVTFHLLSPGDVILASRGTDGSERQHPVYEDRLYWSATGCPVLSNVRVTDSKRYGVQIDCYSPHIKNSTSTKVFNLRVFEPVSKPVITKTGNCSSPNITLSCSVSNGTNVTFCWEILSPSGESRTFNGPELVINHVNEWQQYTFRCTAKNRVSIASSEQTITDPCNRNNFPRTGHLTPYIGAATFLLVLVVIIYTYRKINQVAHDKRCRREVQRPEEKMASLQDGFIEPTYITTLDSH